MRKQNDLYTSKDSDQPVHLSSLIGVVRPLDKSV